MIVAPSAAAMFPSCLAHVDVSIAAGDSSSLEGDFVVEVGILNCMRGMEVDQTKGWLSSGNDDLDALKINHKNAPY